MTLLYGAVFLAAFVYAIQTARRSRPLDLERVARAVFFLLIAAGVLLPGLVGIVNLAFLTVGSLANTAFPASPLDLLATTLVWAGVVLAARRWPERLGETTFVVLALLLATVAKLVYVSFVHVEPLSDFAEMWRLAGVVSDQGLDAAQTWLGPYPFRWTYFERMLPYLLPLRLLFGPTSASYTIPNVVLEGLTSLLIYRMTREWFGKRAARVALAVSLVAVEPLLAAAIPTHDLPGTFWTVLALSVALALWRFQGEGRPKAAWIASGGLGLVVLILDLQRATGGLALVSVSLLGLLVAPRDRRFVAALGTILLPWLILAAGNWTLREASLRIPAPLRANARWMVLAAGTDSWGDGSFTHSMVNYIVPYNTLPIDWPTLALAKLATNTVDHPGARVTSFLRKSRNLYDLGSQTVFYLNAAELRGMGSASPELEARVVAVSRWFSALFLGLLCLALGWLLTTRELPFSSLLPILYLAVLALVLLLLTEVQPRYLYPIWYLGAVYGGALLGRPVVVES